MKPRPTMRNPTGMNHSLAAAWFALDCLFHALVDPHRKKARP